MKVTILGPNLSAAGQAKGEMHVHAAGCADIKRHARKYGYSPSYAWTIDSESIKDIVCDVYPPSDFCYDENSDEYDTYRNDVYVFPCVTLPDVKEEKEITPDSMYDVQEKTVTVFPGSPDEFTVPRVNKVMKSWGHCFTGADADYVVGLYVRTNGQQVAWVAERSVA